MLFQGLLLHWLCVNGDYKSVKISFIFEEDIIMKTNYSSTKIRVREIPPVVKKLLENKAAMQAYSRGEITKDELNKRGIELVNPL
jgi:hypothetical protein